MVIKADLTFLDEFGLSGLTRFARPALTFYQSIHFESFLADEAKK